MKEWRIGGVFGERGNGPKGPNWDEEGLIGREEVGLDEIVWIVTASDWDLGVGWKLVRG